MDWIAMFFGLAFGMSLNWILYGYLLFKRVDAVWDYVRSLDKSDQAQMELIDLLAIHTGIDVRRERERAMEITRVLNQPEYAGASILLRDKSGKLTEFVIDGGAAS